MVLVVGGSLGSAALNEAVGDLVLASRERDDLAVRHLVGERFVAEVGARALPGPDGILYQVIGYEEHMPQVYAAADLVLSRAGASTVAELAAIGLPSILVPWPGAAADHQTDNARALLRGGRGRPPPRAGARARRRLSLEIDTLLADPARARGHGGGGEVGRGDPPQRAAGPAGRGGGGEVSRPAAPLDLSRPGRYHVVGVGGPGMSAIALVLAGMGHAVSGSDVRDTPVLDRLRAAGVDVHIGHDVRHVLGVDAVTSSPAIPADNLELLAAARAGVPVLSRAGMLASICGCARSLAVAGTHGKTTTTSMVAMILAAAGWQPSFLVGGDVNDVGTSARWTDGEWLVVEADESDGSHLELPLYGTILTNVETDHLDHYGSFEAIVAGFDQYLAQIDGPKVVCLDDPVAARLAGQHDAITYGTDPDARYHADEIAASGGSSRFTVHRDGELLGEVELPLRGVHNVRNATGAIAMADADRGPVRRRGRSARPLRWGGAAVRRPRSPPRHHARRRLRPPPGGDRRGARRRGDERRRMAAHRLRVPAEPLQPHGGDVARVPRRLRAADVAVITDIYPSGQTPIPGVTGKLVVDAVCAAHPDQRVVWLPERADLVAFLGRELRHGDVCISMGCGDVAGLPDEVLVALQERDGAA